MSALGGSAAAAGNSSHGGGPPASSAANGDSQQLVVPLATAGVQHLCLEYPGYVGNEEKVLETLGGLDGLARYLQVGAASQNDLLHAVLHWSRQQRGCRPCLAVASTPLFQSCRRRIPSPCRCGCAPPTTTATLPTAPARAAAACWSSSAGRPPARAAAAAPAAAGVGGGLRWWQRCHTHTPGQPQLTTNTSPMIPAQRTSKVGEAG